MDEEREELEGESKSTVVRNSVNDHMPEPTRMSNLRKRGKRGKNRKRGKRGKRGMRRR